MKLEKLSFNPKYDNITNVKNSIVLQALSYAKIYELLHKQLWRKAPYRVWTYNIPQIPTFNGRPVTFIRGWNIKSPSKAPYSYSGGDHTFGLNQLFMSQDYRKPYVGNPKNGIYHDDCYIQPKAMELLSGFIEMWSYVETDGSGYVKHDFKFQKQDAQGNVLINNVRIEVYNKPMVKADGTNYTVLWKRIVVDSVKDGTVYYELDQADIPNSSWYAGFLNFTKTEKTWVEDKAVKESEFIAVHGAVVWKHNTSKESHPVFLSGNIDSAKQGGRGYIMIFTDGTAIEYVPYAIDAWGDDYSESLAHYKILPMMYTDTGDLVMDRIEFVEKWNDYFELIVHEDSEWWQAFIKPAAAIISLVIAINTGLYFGVDSLMFNVAVAGGVASAVGILTDNSTLSLIGGAMVGVAGLTKMVEQGFTQSLLNAGVFPDRAEMLLQSSGAMEIFKGFISTAGFGNWLKIGTTAYGMYSDVAMLGMGSVTQAVEEVADDSGMRVGMSNEEEEEVYDPEKWMKNVIDIL